MKESLSFRGLPQVPSVFTTKENTDYLTGQHLRTFPYPVFHDSVEVRKLCFDLGFYVYLQPRTFHNIFDGKTDELTMLQCACERIFAMTHSPEEWVAIMGRHYISDLDWYDRFSPESDSE